jgi:hypothetical protein
MAPLEGAIRLAGSLRSPVMMVVVVVMMVRLCTWDRADRERNGGDGSQNESKVPHKFLLRLDFTCPKHDESVCSRQTDIYE